MANWKADVYEHAKAMVKSETAKKVKPTASPAYLDPNSLIAKGNTKLKPKDIVTRNLFNRDDQYMHNLLDSADVSAANTPTTRTFEI
ncbi:uncharacterized protein ColSpa_03704 [Colletotrichum spaethianum]|uniref:Uncharacterized protein n=1 Tax=Colletotrichum spaethianum TaxID=700344 RepID=A0AA37P0G9_9PEZI|nr:uncharacterized protein ColSpa_03704 [Colletotrichum spaethianum]GKT43523.1 hypothetical protein ColSpa_03704 [Colletotrichum spaethianum]